MLLSHIGEPPILSGTPLPFLSTKVIMSQSDSPYPCQKHYQIWPPRVIFCIWVTPKVMHQQHRDHCPIQVYHLHNINHRKTACIKHKLTKSLKKIHTHQNDINYTKGPLTKRLWVQLSFYTKKIYIIYFVVHSTWCRMCVCGTRKLRKKIWSWYRLQIVFNEIIPNCWLEGD